MSRSGDRHAVRHASNKHGMSVTGNKYAGAECGSAPPWLPLWCASKDLSLQTSCVLLPDLSSLAAKP